MLSHEFLKAAADFMAGVSEPTTTQQPNQAALTPATAQTDEHPDVNKKAMVGPLQQKLELLKKAVDVDNMYDNPEIPGGDEETAAPADDLDDMKRLAGIIFNAEEDTDGLEG